MTGTAAPTTKRNIDSAGALCVITSSSMTIGREGSQRMVALCVIKSTRQASDIILSERVSLAGACSPLISRAGKFSDCAAADFREGN